MKMMGILLEIARMKFEF